MRRICLELLSLLSRVLSFAGAANNVSLVKSFMYLKVLVKITHMFETAKGSYRCPSRVTWATRLFDTPVFSRYAWGLSLNTSCDMCREEAAVVGLPRKPGESVCCALSGNDIICSMTSPWQQPTAERRGGHLQHLGVRLILLWNSFATLRRAETAEPRLSFTPSD